MEEGEHGELPAEDPGDLTGAEEEEDGENTDEGDEEEADEDSGSECCCGEDGADAGEDTDVPKKKKAKKKKVKKRKKRWAEIRAEREERRAKEAEAKDKPKKPQMRPSIIMRVKPANIDEEMAKFFDSDCSYNPQFTYSYPEATVNNGFRRASDVHDALLSEAHRILGLVKTRFGSPDTYLEQFYGSDRMSTEELTKYIEEYCADRNLADKVEVKVSAGMLSAAAILKPGFESKYIVHVTDQPVSRLHVQSICDHEIGTHLLRMVNDEHQVWHSCRPRHELQNPWVTEEGLATIHTYLSMDLQLMWSQALRYFACCVAAKSSFAETFAALEPHVPDRVKRFRLCVRVKRGLFDTAQPGALNIDQAYFRGAMELMQQAEEIDLLDLYLGQLAWEDLPKCRNYGRRQVVRLPKFLDTEKKLEKYKDMVLAMAKANQLEGPPPAPVFKSMRLYFPKNLPQKKPAPVKVVEVADPRPVNEERLLALSKPKESVSLQDDEAEKKKDLGKVVNQARLLLMAMPKKRVEKEEDEPPPPPPAPKKVKKKRKKKKKRQDDPDESEDDENLNDANEAEEEEKEEDAADANHDAKPPKDENLEDQSTDTGGSEEKGLEDSEPKDLNATARSSRGLTAERLAELCKPKERRESESGLAPPPPVETRPLDLMRLTQLATPKERPDAPGPAPWELDPLPGKVARKLRKIVKSAARTSGNLTPRDDGGASDRSRGPSRERSSRPSSGRAVPEDANFASTKAERQPSGGLQPDKLCGPGCKDSGCGPARWAEIAKPRAALPALDGIELAGVGDRAQRKSARRARSATAPVPVRAKTQMLQAVPIKTLELMPLGLG